MEKSLLCMNCFKYKKPGKFCTCEKMDDESDELIDSFVNVTMEDYFEASAPVQSSSFGHSIEELLEDAQNTIITCREDLLLPSRPIPIKKPEESTGAKKKESSPILQPLDATLTPLHFNEVCGFFDSNNVERRRKPEKRSLRKLPESNLPPRGDKPCLPITRTADFFDHFNREKSTLDSLAELYARGRPGYEAKDKFTPLPKSRCSSERPRDPEDLKIGFDDLFQESEARASFEAGYRAFVAEESKRIERMHGKDDGLVKESLEKGTKSCRDQKRPLKTKKKEAKKVDLMGNPRVVKSTSCTTRTEVNIENSPLGVGKESVRVVETEPFIYFDDSPVRMYLPSFLRPSRERVPARSNTSRKKEDDDFFSRVD